MKAKAKGSDKYQKDDKATKKFVKIEKKIDDKMEMNDMKSKAKKKKKK